MAKGFIFQTCVTNELIFLTWNHLKINQTKVLCFVTRVSFFLNKYYPYLWNINRQKKQKEEYYLRKACGIRFIIFIIDL